MTTLTPEQRQLLKIGGTEPVRLLDPDTNQEYVLLKSETYSQVQAVLGDLDPREMYPALHRALRDEGTSYHYAPPSEFADADLQLVAIASKAMSGHRLRCVVGSSWTTDAPFRETAEAINTARDKGILAVEMEAAALYTFARAAGVKVLCLAHVTNTMGQSGDDFEKGEADGTNDALDVLRTIINACCA